MILFVQNYETEIKRFGQLMGFFRIEIGSLLLQTDHKCLWLRDKKHKGMKNDYTEPEKKTWNSKQEIDKWEDIEQRIDDKEVFCVGMKIHGGM